MWKIIFSLSTLILISNADIQYECKARCVGATFTNSPGNREEITRVYTIANESIDTINNLNYKAKQEFQDYCDKHWSFHFNKPGRGADTTLPDCNYKSGLARGTKPDPFYEMPSVPKLMSGLASMAKRHQEVRNARRIGEIKGMRNYTFEKNIPDNKYINIPLIWKTPLEEICNQNGGNFNGKHCNSNWKNAQKICQAMDMNLPNMEQYEAVILNCGGILTQSQNKKNTSYHTCCKTKGFDSLQFNLYYWTTVSKTNRFSSISDRWTWAMDFYSCDISSRNDDESHSVRCVK